MLTRKGLEADKDKKHTQDERKDSRDNWNTLGWWYDGPWGPEREELELGRGPEGLGPEGLFPVWPRLERWFCSWLGSSQGIACLTTVFINHAVLDTCEIESLSCAAPVGTFELSRLAISWSAVAQASASFRLPCTCSVRKVLS